MNVWSFCHPQLELHSWGKNNGMHVQYIGDQTKDFHTELEFAWLQVVLKSLPIRHFVYHKGSTQLDDERWENVS